MQLAGSIFNVSSCISMTISLSNNSNCILEEKTNKMNVSSSGSSSRKKSSKSGQGGERK